jgi:rod shape-determining protein MreC
MPGPSSTRRNAVILVVLLFAQLLLMSASAKGRDGSTQLEGWWMGISSPLIALGQMVGGGIHGSFTGIGDLLSAKSRNAELQSEVERLRTEVARSREALLENERLRRLLSMQIDLAPRSIGASVVTSVLTENDRMILVDRGHRHGVRRDMPVVAWGGAVGRVVAVGLNNAKVQLLTDPKSGVAGIVQRSRAQGVVVGVGEKRLDLLYVPRFSDVTHGDRVVASGLDGIFPRGFGIGRVIAISQTPDGSQTVQLAPEFDYRFLEEVLILLEPESGDLLPGGAPEEDS